MKNTKLIFAFLLLLTIPIVLSACSTSNPCPVKDAPAPEFILQNLDGEQVSLKDYRGKTVVLNFWQTTCSWCHYQMPFIQKALDKYESSGLAVLAVNVAESREKVIEYRDEGNYTLTFLLDSDAKVNTDYCVPGLPATIFINKEGIIKDAKLGAFQTEGEIDDYLKLLN
jgi:peroxiredoxin